MPHLFPGLASRFYFETSTLKVLAVLNTMSIQSGLSTCSILFLKDVKIDVEVRGT